MYFAQMVSKYRIPTQDFWKYMNLRSCILSAQRKFPLLPETELQKLAQTNQGTRGGALKFYTLETISPTKTGGPQEGMGGGSTR